MTLTYVSLSWYVKVHLGFLIVSPLIKYINTKFKNFQEEIFVFIILPKMLSSILPSYEKVFVGFWENLISSIDLLLFWLPIFYVGIMCAKYNIVEKIRVMSINEQNCQIKQGGVMNILISALVIISALLLRDLWGEDSLTNSLCVMIFVVGFDELYHTLIKRNKIVEKILVFIGKYSFQFWLLSGMFYLNTTEFTWLLYLPKYKILICIWNFVILIPLAILTKKIADSVTQMLLKKYL